MSGTFGDDVTLLVDGQKIYSSRRLLVEASPVFDGIFKDKKVSSVRLPGATYKAVYELLGCLTPAIGNPVTGEGKGFCGCSGILEV